jgi:hypothetical protein
VNETDSVCERLVVSASSDPCFFKTKQWRIDAIGAGQSCRISTLDLQLDGPLLARLSEAEQARVRFELHGAEPGRDPLFTSEHDVELLPRNQWGGLSHLPEMVAAFVQPNDPAVDRLLKRAAQVLRDSSRSAALNGYDTGPKHVWEILSAIWSAVAAERLDYAVPPASFEQTGQKVRSPGQIFEAGIATCLDLALLFAAAAEQAGLNPLIIFTAGHAFAGCWLRQEEFSTAVVDDPSALRKRLLLKELVLFEATVITGASVPAFSRACEIGAKQLAEDAVVAFELAVDVRRARMHKVKPLATAATGTPKTSNTTEASPSATVQIEDTLNLPEELAGEPAEPDPRSLTPADRVTRWQRKLLDLSLRNGLLNFRKAKRAVTFEAPDPGRLEDTLSSGRALKLLPWPELMRGADPRDRVLHEGRTHEDLQRQHALDALARGEIFGTSASGELESNLVDLYRSARASLEEGGANTLFLALGFLIWTQEGKDTARHRAPLILIPVTLNRRSVRSGFTLTLHEDEPQFNPTLVEMLQQDFHLNIGIPEGDLPKDDSGLDVNGIWARVSTAIKDIKGWEVVQDVVLSTFSFAKHLMWKDLVHRTDQLRENPVVRHLIDTPREQYHSDVRFVDPRSLDRECDPSEVFCPLAADSSQLSAILSASRGKDFVLIGPPGTGKSQTISNLIAHCIASGKRVLFVAEKIAALEVVYRRLQKEGLGQFCLEIHSSKAKKADVLQALGAAWGNRETNGAGTWDAEATRLKGLRDRLNLYVERLHQVRLNGMTVHHAVGNVVAGHAVQRVDFQWADPSTHDRARLEGFRSTISKLEVHSAALGVEELTNSPLLPVRQADWDPLWQADFLRCVRETQAATTQVRAAYDALATISGLPTHLGLSESERSAVAQLAGVLPSCVGSTWGFATDVEAVGIFGELRAAASIVSEYRSVVGSIGEPWPTHVIAACRKGITLLRERETLRAALPSPWPTSITEELRRGIELLSRVVEDEGQLSVRYDTSSLNASQIWADWQKAEGSIWPLSQLRKRKLVALLSKAVEGGGQPDPSVDLPVLANLEKTRNEVESINLRALPSGLWSGLQTSIEVAKASLRLQSGLAAARDGKPWVTEDLGLVESGLCGAELKHTLASVSRLRKVDSEIGGLDWLPSVTQGLWRGVDTNCEALAAALDFCDEWRAGELQGAHAAVARGDCGSELHTQCGLLRQRDRLMQRVAGYSHLGARTGGVWRGLDTDLVDLGRAMTFGELLERTIPVCAPKVEDTFALRAGIGRLCQPGRETEQIVIAVTAFSHACSQFGEALALMVARGCLPLEFSTRAKAAGVDEVRGVCEKIAGAGPRLQRWCSWVQVKQEAQASGLAGFVTALESAFLKPSELRGAFEVNYSRWWLDHIVSADEVLRTFVSAEHERRIEDFRTLDDSYTGLTKKLIRARLYASTPTVDSVAVDSEWGILRHEMTKRRRHLPLRELMGRIPTVVTALTPCLLMSPLSIAQYLALSSAAFDVVVFDEASQITVWDAVGAIARAKQVVMVGDPKQLPPTNFFGRADEEPDQSDDVPDDLESILDECIGASLPSLQLSWHYRSRHESLIAFSNRRYYGGKLVTFPSPVTDDRAVSFHYQRGVYEKGGARTNPDEARAVVRDIIAHLKSPDFEHNGYSIGVVTFNAEQQKLIEDLLDSERRSDPAIEPYFGSERLEPVFVKNLESVQGDERDIMYFSITYGPDIAGRLSMNFGPMNRDGGERRLNVAITRARRELRVFSTLRPEQIDLSRTQSKGVSELKHFLEFAERGPRAFAEQVTGSVGDFESPFEEYVASALQSRGWVVHTQIGASDFRIDLGVVHPDAPGIYVAGIECDGATYHRSATARDRDKLREQVLRDLGWEIVRVWSTDWWIDCETTLNALDARLRTILEKSRARRAAVQVPEERSCPLPVPETEDLPDEGHADVPMASSTGEYRLNQVASPQTNGCDASRFFEPSYDAELTQMITGIVESEGPILDELLTRRIARLHGWQRTGTRISERVARIASKACRKTNEEPVGVFFWPRSMETGRPIPFRPGLERGVDEICMPELVSLALDVIAAGHAGEGAVAVMARAIGLQRLRATSRPRLESAIRRAQRRLRE